MTNLKKMFFFFKCMEKCLMEGRADFAWFQPNFESLCRNNWQPLTRRLPVVYKSSNSIF